MRRALPLVLLLLACNRTQKEPPAIDAGSSALGPAASAAPAASSAAPSDEKQEAERLVRAWSDALDRHDLDALEKVYADNVVFYKLGTKPRKAVLAMKKAALSGKVPFHQQIIDRPEIQRREGRYEVVFTKRSGYGAKLGDTKALLVVAGAPLRITEERDQPVAATSCEAVASDVAWSSEPVKKAMDAVRKELPKYPERNEGGIGPETFEDGTIRASIGVHQPERFETIASYVVYPNGRLDVTVGVTSYTTDPSGQTMDGEPAKKLSEAERKRVTVACAPPAESHGH